MKRILSLLCAAFLVCSVSACGTSESSSENSTGDFTSEEQKDTEIVFAENGRSEYSVVIPENASDAIVYAAEELTGNIEEATGAVLSVVSDSGVTFNPEEKVISLGETTVKQESGIEVSVGELTGDGYRIERYGNTVVICGGEDSGTAFGVYEFLSLQFGYEVYAADEIYIEKTDKALLKDFHVKDRPSFEGRDTDGLTDYNHELAYRLRIRKWNSSDSRFDYGASRDWIGGHCHTFYSYISNDENGQYKKEHPEWFSANQLCLTNEDMKKEFIKNAIGMIEDSPTGKYVNIAENDFSGFCNCSTCKDERDRYGMSGYLIRFVNDIIEGIEEWREAEAPERDLKYVTFAYSSGTFNPPVKLDDDGNYIPLDGSVIPHEKLYIRLAPIDYCYSHALTDESCTVNAGCAKALKGWKAITDRFMVWDYDVNYNHYFMFFDLYDNLQKNLVDYYNMGVTNIMRQSSTGSRVSSMCDLKLYLNAKLTWDITEDQETLTDAFMENFYKAGAPYMKQYLTMMRSYLSVRDKENSTGVHYQLYDRVQPTLSTAQLWPKRILEQAIELFEKAYAEYDKMEDRALAEVLHNRVLKESVCVRYIILKNYGSYYNINSPEYEEMIEQFEKDVQTVEAYNYCEGKNTSDWINSLH